MKKLEREFSFCFHYSVLNYKILKFFKKFIFDNSKIELSKIELICDSYLSKKIRIRESTETSLIFLCKKSGKKSNVRTENSVPISSKISKILKSNSKLRILKLRYTYAIKNKKFESIVFLIDIFIKPMVLKIVEIEYSKTLKHVLKERISEIPLIQNKESAWDFFQRKIKYLNTL